jgi:hypothetical protein
MSRDVCEVLSQLAGLRLHGLLDLHGPIRNVVRVLLGSPRDVRGLVLGAPDGVLGIVLGVPGHLEHPVLCVLCGFDCSVLEVRRLFPCLARCFGDLLFTVSFPATLPRTPSPWRAPGSPSLAANLFRL